MRRETLSSTTHDVDGLGQAGDKLCETKSLSHWSAREIGRVGEDIACAYLEGQGYELVDRNWRCAFGEADAVCLLEQDSVALVEVKTRLNLRDATKEMPEIAVGPTKRKRYGNIALRYLTTHPRVTMVRFDVIAVVIDRCDHAQLRHLVDAFTWDDAWMR